MTRTRPGREWHRAHRMPPRASDDERIAWHLEHAAQCGCRAVPPRLLQEMARRGIDPPRVAPPG